AGVALLDGFTISGGNANGSSSITVNSFNIWRSFGGGIFNSSSSPVLTNVTLSGNTAHNRGGGMYNFFSSPKIHNSIIWGNTAADGTNIYNDGSDSKPEFFNSLIQGSGGSTGWDITFGTDGGNNIDSDPLFTDP